MPRPFFDAASARKVPTQTAAPPQKAQSRMRWGAAPNVTPPYRSRGDASRAAGPPHRSPGAAPCCPACRKSLPPLDFMPRSPEGWQPPFECYNFKEEWFPAERNADSLICLAGSGGPHGPEAAGPEEFACVDQRFLSPPWSLSCSPPAPPRPPRQGSTTRSGRFWSSTASPATAPIPPDARRACGSISATRPWSRVPSCPAIRIRA